MGQVVLGCRAALVAELEAVVFDLEERYRIRPAGQRLVQYQDGRLDARIGLEHAGGQGHYRDQVFVHQFLAQPAVGVLALEHYPLRNDDSGAPARGEVIGYVVHEQHFAALRLDGEAVVRPNAALRRHEGRVCEDYVRRFVPAVFIRQRIVLVDARLQHPVQVHVHQRQANHVGRYVVSPEIVRQPLLVVRGQRGYAVRVLVGGLDMLVGGYEESGGAAGGVENPLVLLGVYRGYHEVYDVARGEKLPGVPLRAER